MATIYNKMFVYLTVCLVNGKKYIGKYEDSEHHPYLGSGKLLRRAIKKYGVSNFERTILERFQTAEDCREGEKKWITLFDAVNSKEFYNIAQGGEGGNTFAGIKGASRLRLIAKLKKRRRGASKSGTTACWSIEEQKIIRVPQEEFSKKPYLIGSASRGLYITPRGVFCSAKLASNVNQLEMSSLIKRCRKSFVTVNRSHITSDPINLRSEDFSKTFRELGWDYVPKNLITTQFVNQNPIQK